MSSHRALLLAAAGLMALAAGCSTPPPPVEAPPPPSDPLHASPSLAAWRNSHPELFQARDLGPRADRKSLYLWAQQPELKERLHEVGSLTDAHFDALFQIVAEANEINASILALISRGGFDPERVKELVKQAPESIRAELDRELRAYVGERAMKMVENGINKAAGLEAGSARALVLAVEPGAAKDQIAKNVLAELRPDDVDVAATAVADAPERAKILSAWFGSAQAKPIRTAENLQKLAGHYEGDERLLILGQHIATLEDLDADSLLELVNMVPEQGRWSLFEAGLKTVPDYEALQLYALADAMGAKRSSAAVLFGVRGVARPSLEDAKKLLELMSETEATSQVARVLAQRIDPLDAAGLISLVEGIEGRPKDDALAAGLARLRDISVDDAITVIDAAHARQRGLAVIAASNLNDLDLDGLLKLTDKVEHDGRDRVLWSGLRRLRPPPDADGIMRIKEAAYSKKRDLVVGAIEETPKLTALELAAIVDEFHGPARDAVMLAGLKKVDRLTPKQLAKLQATAHAQDEEIAKAGLRRVFGLNIDALATVIKKLPDEPHDNVLRFGIRYLQSLHDSDVEKLVALARKDKEAVEVTAKQLLAEARLKRRERLAAEQEQARLEQAEQMNPEIPPDEDN